MKLPRASTLCTASVCTNLASVWVNQLRNSTDIDPCEDFEAYVCNGFRATHAIRPDQGHVTYDNILQDEAEDILRGFLDSSEAPIRSPADDANWALLRTAWTSCNDLDAVRAAGAGPVVDLLKKVEATLPLRAATSSGYGAGGASPSSDVVTAADSKEIAAAQILLQEIGIGSIASLGVTVDDKNPHQRILQLMPPSSITLATKYYKSNDTMAEYTSVMAQVLGAIHPSVEQRANATALAADLVALETKLSALIPDFDVLYDVTLYYNLVPYSQAVSVAPLFDFDTVFKRFIPQGYNVSNVIAPFPEYLGNASAIILGTPRATLQAYFMWQIITTHYANVNATEVLPYMRFRNKLSGRDPDSFPERWRFCQNYIFGIDSIGWIMSRFYVAEHFSERARQLGVDMVDAVRQQFIKTINSLDWMDDVVKQGAVSKLMKMTEKIGFPTKNPNISDPNSIADYYKGISLTPTSYFGNLMTLTKWYQNKTWANLLLPVDPDEWDMTSHTVNAYFDPAKNTIAFPAAIMQPPYFHPDLPAYVNFGAWGATVGHETSHGFDDNGRYYDAEGRLVPSWWTPATDNAFKERAQCFVREYDNYTVTGIDGQPLHLSGENTLGENIADAGGLDVSYLAWQAYRAKHPESDTDMPGLGGDGAALTHEKLFFVSYANSWCSKYTESNLVGAVYSDVHAPAPFRVTGPVANSPWFRQAWGCRVKEPTCKLW